MNREAYEAYLRGRPTRRCSCQDGDGGAVELEWYSHAVLQLNGRPLGAAGQNGMGFSEAQIDQLLIGEIISQATYCLDGFEGVKAAVDASSVNGVYRELHSVLVHAGNVSKLLWPDHVSKADKAARMSQRAERIRTQLRMSDESESPLRKRAPRNHLEHFDERFDDWAAKAPDGLIDRNVGPRESLGRFPDDAWLRSYPPNRKEFTFGDEAFDMGGDRGGRRRYPDSRAASASGQPRRLTRAWTWRAVTFSREAVGLCAWR